jgi:hypothetical protein
MKSELYHRINELLWQEWDPIGVNNYAEARDEYCNYASQIEGLLIKGTDKNALAQYLYNVETKRMGLTGDQQRNEDVASKLLDLTTDASRT